MVNVHDDRKRFDLAKNYKVPFGKFKGMTLNDAAAEDDGLRYLDWMAGLDDLRPETKTALVDFLTYRVVASDLDAVLAARTNQGR